MTGFSVFLYFVFVSSEGSSYHRPLFVGIRLSCPGRLMKEYQINLMYSLIS